MASASDTTEIPSEVIEARCNIKYRDITQDEKQRMKEFANDILREFDLLNLRVYCHPREGIFKITRQPPDGDAGATSPHSVSFDPDFFDSAPDFTEAEAEADDIGQQPRGQTILNIASSSTPAPDFTEAEADDIGQQPRGQTILNIASQPASSSTPAGIQTSPTSQSAASAGSHRTRTRTRTTVPVSDRLLRPRKPTSTSIIEVVAEPEAEEEEEEEPQKKRRQKRGLPPLSARGRRRGRGGRSRARLETLSDTFMALEPRVRGRGRGNERMESLSDTFMAENQNLDVVVLSGIPERGGWQEIRVEPIEPTIELIEPTHSVEREEEAREEEARTVQWPEIEVQWSEYEANFEPQPQSHREASVEPSGARVEPSLRLETAVEPSGARVEPSLCLETAAAGSSAAGSSRPTEHTTELEAKLAVLRTLGNSPHFLGMSIYLLQEMPTPRQPVDYQQCVVEGLMLASRLFNIGGPAIRATNEPNTANVPFENYFQSVCLGCLEVEIDGGSMILKSGNTPPNDPADYLAAIDICRNRA